MTPTAYLDSIGVLGPTTIGAHGVWVNDADIAILKRTATPASRTTRRAT